MAGGSNQPQSSPIIAANFSLQDKATWYIFYWPLFMHLHPLHEAGQDVKMYTCNVVCLL